MSFNLVTKLRSFVQSDRFLSCLDLARLDDILDARDADPFDTEWCRVHQLVMQRQPETSSAIDGLRESAFKRAIAITKSPDASGYISDDFGLLADADRTGVVDAWLAALAASYASGALPHGSLPPDSRSLSEILTQFGS